MADSIVSVESGGVGLVSVFASDSTLVSVGSNEATFVTALIPQAEIVKVHTGAEPVVVRVFTEGPQGIQGPAADTGVVEQALNNAISTITIDGSYF